MVKTVAKTDTNVSFPNTKYLGFQFFGSNSRNCKDSIKRIFVPECNANLTLRYWCTEQSRWDDRRPNVSSPYARTTVKPQAKIIYQLKFCIKSINWAKACPSLNSKTFAFTNFPGLLCVQRDRTPIHRRSQDAGRLSCWYSEPDLHSRHHQSFRFDRKGAKTVKQTANKNKHHLEIRSVSARSQRLNFSWKHCKQFEWTWVAEVLVFIAFPVCSYKAEKIKKNVRTHSRANFSLAFDE